MQCRGKMLALANIRPGHTIRPIIIRRMDAVGDPGCPAWLEIKLSHLARMLAFARERSTVYTKYIIKSQPARFNSYVDWQICHSEELVSRVSGPAVPNNVCIELETSCWCAYYIDKIRVAVCTQWDKLTTFHWPAVAL